MESGERNRLRLWLRSERALGLSAVPRVPRRERVGAIVKSEPPAEPVKRQVTQEAAEQPSSGGLFADAGPPPRTTPPPPLVPLPIVQEFEAQVLPTEEKRRRLIAMDANEVRCCTRCRLHETRKNTAFGEGSVDA